MKLVVQYSTGSYDDHYTHTYCVEYESKDHFGVAFIDAFSEWSKHHRRYRELQKNLGNARDRHQRDLAWEAWQEFCWNPEYKNIHNIIINGELYAVIEDYTEKDGVYEITAMPTIHTLDEWFDLNRPEAVKV